MSDRGEGASVGESQNQIYQEDTRVAVNLHATKESRGCMSGIYQKNHLCAGVRDHLHPALRRPAFCVCSAVSVLRCCVLLRLHAQPCAVKQILQARVGCC